MKALLSLMLTGSVLIARAADPAPHSEIRIKETAPRNYLCTKKELKIAEMHEFAPEAITRLFEAAMEARLGQGGPVMFTYFNFQGDPNQTFTAEIGLPIAKADAPKTEGLYVRQTGKFKCATAIFQGPLTKLGEAWQSFAPGAATK